MEFRYAVGVDYDSSNSCHGECKDYYCHHGKISNVRIEGVNPKDIATEIESHIPAVDERLKASVFLYCLERFTHQLRPQDFRVDVGQGYYGQEISSVTLRDERPLKEFLAIEPWDTCTQVEFILTREYGYVLDSLKGQSSWVAEEVELSKVLIGNEYRKLDRGAIERYREELQAQRSVAKGRRRPNPPMLSCLTHADFRLVDGYHRHRASLEEGCEKILTIHPK